MSIIEINKVVDMESIIIKNAHENNLKNLDLTIPINAFTCVTGCSGCGKSSLVFDTIYAESQRSFLEGMTGNIQGQKLMNKPKVDSIENLRPALNISQNYYNVNPRSTVGTITEISYYLRALFSLVNSDKTKSVRENTFSSNNPRSFCPNCFGLGVEVSVSENLLIPDKNKTLREGAITFYKGSPESKEQKCLEAFCDHYGIDMDCKISKLSSNKIQLLLYADEHIRYKLAYKEGKRRKQHYVILQGVVTTIKDKIERLEANSPSNIYAKYLEEIPCHICGGSKLKQEVLKYTVGGLNYDEIERMEISSLKPWLHNLKDKRITKEKKVLVDQLVNSMISKITAITDLNVGYLCLNRPIPTLSGGERQRVRIATQLTCSLKGLIYILDEPCKGLHYRDITSIIKASRELIDHDNTIIAIEHNKRYIASSDYTIELGPVGGPDGGYLLGKVGKPAKYKLQPEFKKGIGSFEYIEIKGINLRNIKDQVARIPCGGITCVTGVSGSGKSTLANVVYNCISGRTAGYCSSFDDKGLLKRAIQVNQAPIGKTPRSTVVSYLEIFDEIRTLFSKTDAAKKLKLNASMFSMNVKGGRCECCQGTGLQKIELNYLPSSFITCPECSGRRFNDDVLSVTYKGKTIHDVLETPVTDIIELFEDSKKIHSVLSSMIELGLGYLTLGQMSMNLSGGEAQRIKLAKALGGYLKGGNLYILDEPTSGLNDVDIERFIGVLLSLQKKGETILIIEHNVEFIARVADYIIDFGVYGGQAGGRIVSQGLPQDVFNNKKSSLNGLDGL